MASERQRPSFIIQSQSETFEVIEIDDASSGVILQNLISGDNMATDTDGSMTIQEIDLEDFQNSVVNLQEESLGIGTSAYILNQETGEIQQVDLSQLSNASTATMAGVEEVEIITIASDHMNSNSFIDPSLQQTTKGKVRAQELPLLRPKPVSRGQTQNSSVKLPPMRLKNAPLLLRNSRRTVMERQANASISDSPSSGDCQPTSTIHVPASKSGKTAGRGHSKTNIAPMSKTKVAQRKGGKRAGKIAPSSTISIPSRSQLVILDSAGHNLQEIGQIDLSQTITIEEANQNSFFGSNLVVDESMGSESNTETYNILFQSEDSQQQVPQLVDSTLDSTAKVKVTSRRLGVNNVVYQVESSELVNQKDSVSLKAPKSQKSTKKRPRKRKSKDDKIPKKPATELKCMEPDCPAIACNIVELRKHLTACHDITFDSETVYFPNEAAFQEWREQYERERMVSFIYRGGTKKISKENSVTYMVCHRSGHYKPTMGDVSKRKRRMKPQGSCKIGGYCTAGIKLLKNTVSQDVKMEICHTHYGHPLDSEAIPHLRVNPALKKIILKKFEEGMTFSEMLAYIHHNPDGLEGLRVVDRRAVRNIYDTWKKPTLSKQPFETESASLDFEGIESCEQNKSDLISVSNNLDLLQVDQKSGSSTSLDDQIQDGEQPSGSYHSAPKLYAYDDTNMNDASNTNVAVKCEMQMDDDDSNCPPLLIAIESITSLNPNLKTKSNLPCKRKIESKSNTKTKKSKVNCDIKDEKMSMESDPCLGSSSESLRSKGSNKSRPKQASKSRKHKLPGMLIQNASGSPTLTSSKDSDSLPSKSHEFNKPKKGQCERVSSLENLFSPELEATVDRLHNHGESGPTILLYKKVGEIAIKYGGFYRAFKEDDFCLMIQTPVQRQIMQMFPKIIAIEILESPPPNDHDLKLVYVSVLDDFREAIPVAWMVSNSVSTKTLNQFFRVLRYHCGELAVHYIMAPKYVDISKTWTSHFSHKPKVLQSEFCVRRDLRTILNRHFPNNATRAAVWTTLEKLMYGKNIKSIKDLTEKLKTIINESPSGPAYLRKMEKDWLCRTEEWSFAYRVGATPNLLFVADGFLKLKKFISFKGTKLLNQSVDHILKIGYDKCFLRTKRMFKGDQKFCYLLEKIEKHHHQAKESLHDAVVTENPENQTWKVETGDQVAEVFHLRSPCDCKVVCKGCKVCMHEYMCSCDDFIRQRNMCAHIHKVHCFLNQISLEDKPVETETALPEESACEPNLDHSDETSILSLAPTTSFVEKADGISNKTEITIINDGQIDDINISEVLQAAAGLFAQDDNDGGDQNVPKIITIADGASHNIIESNELSSGHTINISITL